jgi:hypothetical protein
MKAEAEAAYHAQAKRRLAALQWTSSLQNQEPAVNTNNMHDDQAAIDVSLSLLNVASNPHILAPPPVTASYHGPLSNPQQTPRSITMIITN